MTSFLLGKFFIAILVFFTVNLFGGLSIGLGYIQIHYRYKRELFPAFNHVFKIISPVLVTILFGIIFYLTGYGQFNKQIWLSLVFSWAIRLAYIILWRRYLLMNMGIFLFHFIASSAIGLWVYSKLIGNPILLLPSRDNMVSQIWLIVILFLYKSFEDLRFGDNRSFMRKKKYILVASENFKRKYLKKISKITSDEIVETIVFAVIIVENFNRPKLARIAEQAISPFRESGTYGIMQVKCAKALSDLKSVEIGTKAISDIYDKVKSASDENRPSWNKDDERHLSEIVHRVAWLYNNSDDYANEVYNVFNQIRAASKANSEAIPTEKLYNAYFTRPRIAP